jgi:hypothetical protein
MALKKKLLLIFVLTIIFSSCAFAAYAAEPITINEDMNNENQSGLVTDEPTTTTTDTTTGDSAAGVADKTVTAGSPETGMVTKTYDDNGNLVSTTTVSPIGTITATTANSLNGVIGYWNYYGEFVPANNGVTGFWNNFGEFILY